MNREILSDAGYGEAIVFENPDYDDAIIGVTDDERVVYDFQKMVQHLEEHYDMDPVGAVDFIEYNTIRALEYIGEGAPIVMRRLEDL